MTKDPKTFSSVDVSLGFGPEGARRAGDSGGPLSVIMIGDFTGRGTRDTSDATLGERRPMRVDPDTLPGLMARLRPRLRVEREGRHAVEIEMESLDDFSPDGLVRRIDPLRDLRRLRRQLQQPATFESARAELHRLGAAAPRPAPPAPPAGPALPRDAAQDLVADLLASPAPRERADDELGVNAFVQEIVGRHVQPAPHEDVDALTAQVDAALSAEVRALLRAPATRALEAAWRAVHLVADRVALGDRVTLDILDATRDELARDVASAGDQGASALAKRLARGGGAQGDEPYALVVALFPLEATPQDASLLARLSLVAQSLGATLLCDGDARLAGCDSLARSPDSDDWNGTLADDAAQAWAACQMLPSAAHVGLAVPRVLLRAPHGERTTPAETFGFEEIDDALRHEDLLWGSGAAACAAAIMAGRAASEGGGEPSAAREVGDLPLFVHDTGGERQQVPCAEAWLTERSARVLVEAGLIPLLSVKGSTTIRVGAWRSLAQPPAPLAGRAMG